MAKKVVKTKSTKSSWWVENKHLVIPSLIGAAIAWFASGDEGLAIAVFIGVWIGNLIGSSMKK